MNNIKTEVEEEIVIEQDEEEIRVVAEPEVEPLSRPIRVEQEENWDRFSQALGNSTREPGPSDVPTTSRPEIKQEILEIPNGEAPQSLEMQSSIDRQMPNPIELPAYTPNVLPNQNNFYSHQHQHFPMPMQHSEIVNQNQSSFCLPYHAHLPCSAHCGSTFSQHQFPGCNQCFMNSTRSHLFSSPNHYVYPTHQQFSSTRQHFMPINQNFIPQGLNFIPPNSSLQQTPQSFRPYAPPHMSSTLAQRMERASARYESRRARRNRLMQAQLNRSMPAQQRQSTPERQREIGIVQQRGATPARQRESTPVRHRESASTQQRESTPARQMVSRPAQQIVSTPARQMVSMPAQQIVSTPARQMVSRPARQMVSTPPRQMETTPAAQRREMAVQTTPSRTREEEETGSSRTRTRQSNQYFNSTISYQLNATVDGSNLLNITDSSMNEGPSTSGIERRNRRGRPKKPENQNSTPRNEELRSSSRQSQTRSHDN